MFFSMVAPNQTWKTINFLDEKLHNHANVHLYLIL
jgi:hypothetical protein